MRRKSPRHGLYALCAGLLVGSGAPAQESGLPARAEHTTSAEHKRGSKQAPTHRPTPDLPPLRVLHHLKEGNRAVAAARKAKKPAPKARPRPPGAGRYLCAIFTCSDADVDVAGLFGLDRRDVLVFANPGPFVSHEALAALEHYVTEERLPLVIVLGHTRCSTLEAKTGRTPYQEALARRIRELRKKTRTGGQALTKVLVRTQREVILASSKAISAAGKEDKVRIVAAEVDDRTRAVTWHVRSGEALPMPAVK